MGQTRRAGARTGLPHLSGIAALTAVALAGCQSPLDEAYGVRTIQLTDTRAHFDLIVRDRERDQESKSTGIETRSEETLVEERLSIKTDGYVLHPNLFDFGLGAMFGLVQEDFSETIGGRERRSSDTGDINEFDFTAQIFKRRKTPMTVFAHRRRDIIPRPFLSSLETTTESYGFNWRYLSDKTPTSFQFDRVDTDLNPLFASGAADERGRQRTTRASFETGYIFSEHHSLMLSYDHESTEEQPVDLDFDTDQLTLTHRIRFGDRHQHELRSELYGLRQRGTIDRDRRRWTEDLRLRHTDTLDSQWQFEVLDRSRTNRSPEVPRIEERSIRFLGLFRHRLFKSQVTQLQFFARRQDFKPELKLTRWGGQLNVDYRKNNPGGVLHANYSVRAERNDQEGEGRFVEVIGETQTFRDPEPIVLNNRNVNTGSVTVRAQDGLTFYERGRDFTLRTIADFVELARIPTGRIADRETVLIDYLFTAGGSFKLDTVRHNLEFRQDFDLGVTPYYRFERQDQTLSPDNAAGAIAEDITGHIAGLRYERQSLRLFAEYEDHDSTLNPFRASRLGFSWSHQFRGGGASSINGHWTDMRNEPPNEREIRLFTIEGRHRQPITPNFAVECAVLHRNGEDSISGDTEGIDFSVSVEWRVRATEVRLTFDHGRFEDDFNRNESTALFLHVKRELW